MEAERSKEIADTRKSQVGSGDRRRKDTNIQFSAKPCDRPPDKYDDIQSLTNF